MKSASKNLMIRLAAASLLALACVAASAHGHDGGYWRPQHHHHGWYRPYYPRAYPPAYYAPPPVYAPPAIRPPVVVAPPVWAPPMPGWGPRPGWR